MEPSCKDTRFFEHYTFVNIKTPAGLAQDVTIDVYYQGKEFSIYIKYDLRYKRWYRLLANTMGE